MKISHDAGCVGEAVLALQRALRQFDRRGGATTGVLKQIGNIEVWVEVRLADELGPQKRLEGPKKEAA